ncbi:hypothetical protein MLD38_003513 [Melastoma candidum]|uniref:Uncharacterized protein n=1 Tax=Melastoma candidum TaxID=119954 RepID=A0ACB9S4D3_9MYRT|nr:hypothetical protein MLD38_003513 [Melastoma candidum]
MSLTYDQVFVQKSDVGVVWGSFDIESDILVGKWRLRKEHSSRTVPGRSKMDKLLLLDFTAGFAGLRFLQLIWRQRFQDPVGYENEDIVDKGEGYDHRPVVMISGLFVCFLWLLGGGVVRDSVFLVYLRRFSFIGVGYLNFSVPSGIRALLLDLLECGMPVADGTRSKVAGWRQIQ